MPLPEFPHTVHKYLKVLPFQHWFSVGFRISMGFIMFLYFPIFRVSEFVAFLVVSSKTSKQYRWSWVKVTGFSIISALFCNVMYQLFDIPVHSIIYYCMATYNMSLTWEIWITFTSIIVTTHEDLLENSHWASQSGVQNTKSIQNAVILEKITKVYDDQQLSRISWV